MTHDDEDGPSSVSSQLSSILSRVSRILQRLSLLPSDIILTTILLRQMSDFPLLNNIYGQFFPDPLPPARVTISCGSALPAGTQVSLTMLINTSASNPQPSPSILADFADLTNTLEPQPLSTAPPPAPPRPPKRGLHVQSRSYWAPANIGPYSQAIHSPLTPLSPLSPLNSTSFSSPPPTLVHIAGQIPLLPSSMTLPPPTFSPLSPFSPTSSSSPSSPSSSYPSSSSPLTPPALALQHLTRIARATHVTSFLGAIAAIRSCAPEVGAERARAARDVWEGFHRVTYQAQVVGVHDTSIDDEVESDDEGFDVWHARMGGGGRVGASASASASSYGGGTIEEDTHIVPDWSCIDLARVDDTLPPTHPPLFTIQTHDLPLSSPIELLSTGLSSGRLRIERHRHGVYVLRVENTRAVVVWVPIVDWGGMGGVEEEGVEEGRFTEGVEEVVRGFTKGVEEVVSGFTDGREGIWTVYVAGAAMQGMQGSWVRRVRAGVVPCERVWGEEGEIGGVVVVRVEG